MMNEERYVNLPHLIDYLRKVRQNRNVNISPYMDSVLLNVQQMIEFDMENPLIADSFVIGGCGSCKWSGRKQKCSCCRRNRYIKDCWEAKHGTTDI